MKRQLLFTTLVSTLFAAMCVSADDSGLYGGVSGGRSKAMNNVTSASQIDAQNATAGLISNSNIDATDRVWKLYGGYKFFKYFAVEGSFTHFGNVTANSLITASASGTGLQVQTARSKAAGLSALGILPLPYHFELFGKAGVDHWESTYSSLTTLTSLPPPPTIPPTPPTPPVITTTSSSMNEKGTSSFYGAGLGYSLTDNLAIRGEWERFKKIGNNPLIKKSDIDVYSVGVKFIF